MESNALNLSVYLVTSCQNKNKKDFLNTIEEAIQGGVTIVQLREKTLESCEFYKLACALKELCVQYKVPLLINDRIDIALACKADGVHIGQNDLPIKIAREILGEDKIIGLSVRTLAHLKDSSYANYLGVGAVFATRSKDNSVVIGTKGLNQILAHTNLPIVAIGGIKRDLICRLDKNISGIAVISAIMESKDPKKASIELKEAFLALKNLPS